MHNSIMLITLMLLFTLSQPSASNALESQTAFKQACSKAWDKTARGYAKSESGFTVAADGSISKILVQYNSGSGEVDLPVNAQTRYAVHVHPNMLEDKPSPGDVRAAVRWGHPVYVISQSGLWEAEPNGSVVRVYEGTGWMR